MESIYNTMRLYGAFIQQKLVFASVGITNQMSLMA
jgi:hypothetical protein